MKRVTYPGTTNKWKSPILSPIDVPPHQNTYLYANGYLKLMQQSEPLGYYQDYNVLDGFNQGVTVVDKYTKFDLNGTIIDCNGAICVTKILEPAQMISISKSKLSSPGDIMGTSYFTLVVNNVILMDTSDIINAEVSLADMQKYLSSLGWFLEVSYYTGIDQQEETNEMLSNIKLIKGIVGQGNVKEVVPILIQCISGAVSFNGKDVIASPMLLLRLM